MAKPKMNQKQILTMFAQGIANIASRNSKNGSSLTPEQRASLDAKYGKGGWGEDALGIYSLHDAPGAKKTSAKETSAGKTQRTASKPSSAGRKG